MRKKFLIKPSLQLKHLFLTLVVVLISFVACYALFERQVAIAVSNSVLDEPRWLELRNHLRLGFACTLLLLLAGIGLENYFFFHSIAGPIYALEKALKRLAQGEYGHITRIRETDQLSELIQAFEEMKRQILLKMESQEKTAQLLVQEIDELMENTSQIDIEHLRKRIQEIKRSVENKTA